MIRGVAVVSGEVNRSPILPPLAGAYSAWAGTRLVWSRHGCQMLRFVADVSGGNQSAAKRTFQGQVPGLQARRLKSVLLAKI